MANRKRSHNFTIKVPKGLKLHIESTQILSQANRSEMPAFDGNKYALRERVWATKVNQPGRKILEYNEDKIAETILNPDFARQSKSDKNRILCYKSYDNWIKDESGDNIAVVAKLMVVIIDQNSRLIVSIRRSLKATLGEQIWPKN